MLWWRESFKKSWYDPFLRYANHDWIWKSACASSWSENSEAEGITWFSTHSRLIWNTITKEASFVWCNAWNLGLLRFNHCIHIFLNILVHKHCSWLTWFYKQCITNQLNLQRVNCGMFTDCCSPWRPTSCNLNGFGFFYRQTKKW